MLAVHLESLSKVLRLFTTLLLSCCFRINPWSFTFINDVFQFYLDSLSSLLWIGNNTRDCPFKSFRYHRFQTVRLMLWQNCQHLQILRWWIFDKTNFLFLLSEVNFLFILVKFLDHQVLIRSHFHLNWFLSPKCTIIGWWLFFLWISINRLELEIGLECAIHELRLLNRDPPQLREDSLRLVEYSWCIAWSSISFWFTLVKRGIACLVIIKALLCFESLLIKRLLIKRLRFILYSHHWSHCIHR